MNPADTAKSADDESEVAAEIEKFGLRRL